MDAFTADYLANLTADLTAQVLNAAARRLRQSWQGAEGEQALGRAVQAGVLALLATASAAQPEETALLAEIFSRFFSDEEVGKEVADLLRGRGLNQEELTFLFAEAGFDAETLPGLDLDQGLAAFEAAFVLAAAGEPLLQDTVATGQLLKQTRLQTDMVAILRELVGLVQRAGDSPFAVQQGRIIAQGGGVAGGDYSINVGGSVHGGITVIHKHEAAARPDFSAAYCEALIQRCNVLPIAALGGEEDAGDEEITLDQVYIALDTTAKIPTEKGKRGRADMLSEGMGREERPLSALEAATGSQHLVLRGDPGGGKSTFVRQLAARLAAAHLAGEVMQEGWDRGLLPVLTTLRELAARLATLELRDLSQAEADQQLADVVWQQWRHDLQFETRVQGFADDLEKALRAGRVVLIFDGLDEVALPLRPLLRRTLAAVQRIYPKVRRLIVTCRVRSYTGKAVLPGFEAVTLAPFDDAKIRQFCAAWYAAQADKGRVKRDLVSKRVEDFQAAALSDDLQEMASNPMLLTTMAIIHQRDIGLPKERVRLFNEAVKVLIGRWQKHKGLPPPPALAPVLADDLKLRQILEMIAYEAHQAQAKQGPEARLSRLELLTLLEKPKYLGNLACADAFLDYVDQRAGMLVGYGGDEEGDQPLTYDFAHRSFQEYLAGRYMVGQSQPQSIYRQRAAEGDFWYQAAIYGAEDLLYNRQLPPNLLSLAYRLCPEALPQSEAHWREVVWSGQMAALLDVESIRADAGDRDGGEAYLKRLLPRLADVLDKGRLNPIERAAAGVVLGKLGDPREGVGVSDGLPDILWSEVIPAGPFPMGNDKPEARYKDEQPRFQCTLIRQPYRISRYAITVAQYRCFIRAEGYQTAKWWSKAGWAWRKENAITGPRTYGEPFELDNHPQVGVSWYEAHAFCQWLAEATGLPIRLPSEAEWERAARHTDARLYPWGQEAPNLRCNMSDTGIGSTCAVGLFPDGDAVCGAANMSGNVWEWCRTKWRGNYERYEQQADDDPAGSERRVVRGGSWFGDESSVRCAFRRWYDPDDRFSNSGFRVVCSPSTFDL